MLLYLKNLEQQIVGGGGGHFNINIWDNKTSHKTREPAFTEGEVLTI